LRLARKPNVVEATFTNIMEITVLCIAHNWLVVLDLEVEVGDMGSLNHWNHLFD